MNNYVKFGGLGAVVVAVPAWLAASGVDANKSYYKTITELSSMGERAKDTHLRVGGDIVAGSIVRSAATVKFTLKQGARTLPVVYTGTDPLPDTFRDGSQALADGRLGADGVFTADKVQAKCASKYQAKPPQNKNAAINRAAM